MPNERGYINELQVVDDDERKFAGWATVEVVDRQGEVLNIDDVTKIMDVIMKRGGAIIDSHTNRVVGKLLNWQKTLHPMTQKDAIRVTGMIFKDYVIDNVVWDKIKEKIYKGLSFGGSSLKKIPSIEGGRPIETLRQLEGYEISVCENPANPHALIDDINMLAKSNVDERDKLARERVYLEPGQEAPEGAKVQEGSRGGRYYDTSGKPGRTAEGPYGGKIPTDKEELPPRGTGRRTGDASPRETGMQRTDEERAERHFEKKVIKRGNEWCVIHCHGPKKGQTIACHPTKEKADAQHRAIEANKSVDNMTMAYFQMHEIPFAGFDNFEKSVEHFKSKGLGKSDAWLVSANLMAKYVGYTREETVKALENYNKEEE